MYKMSLPSSKKCVKNWTDSKLWRCRTVPFISNNSTPVIQRVPAFIVNMTALNWTQTRNTSTAYRQSVSFSFLLYRNRNWGFKGVPLNQLVPQASTSINRNAHKSLLYSLRLLFTLSVELRLLCCGQNVCEISTRLKVFLVSLILKLVKQPKPSTAENVRFRENLTRREERLYLKPVPLF